MGELRERIASHDPNDCEHCWEYRDRRWRMVWSKEAGETQRRAAVVGHVGFFARRALGRRVAYPEDAGAMDEYVGRGIKVERAKAPGDGRRLTHWDLPPEIVMDDGAGSDAIPELQIPQDTSVPSDHDETTCPVCVYWARASVYALQNIADLERKWVDRDPDEHIAPEATDEQRAFWRESFEHTSRVIWHVLTVRPKGEDALTWHGRVLRANVPDDEVAMHNLEWFEMERDRRKKGVPLDEARRAYPKRDHPAPHLYPDGVFPIGSGEDPTRNKLLVMYLKSYGLDWAQGTRYAENIPAELMRRVPAFMRHPRRH